MLTCALWSFEMKDLLKKKNILESEYKRDPEEEFPRQCVVHFVFSWIQELIAAHGDIDLIVSLVFDW